MRASLTVVVEACANLGVVDLEPFVSRSDLRPGVPRTDLKQPE
jgi:hypothetical protein